MFFKGIYQEKCVFSDFVCFTVYFVLIRCNVGGSNVKWRNLDIPHMSRIYKGKWPKSSFLIRCNLKYRVFLTISLNYTKNTCVWQIKIQKVWVGWGMGGSIFTNYASFSAFTLQIAISIVFLHWKTTQIRSNRMRFFFEPHTRRITPLSPIFALFLGCVRAPAHPRTCDRTERILKMWVGIFLGALG